MTKAETACTVTTITVTASVSKDLTSETCILCFCPMCGNAVYRFIGEELIDAVRVCNYCVEEVCTAW